MKLATVGGTLEPLPPPPDALRPVDLLAIFILVLISGLIHGFVYCNTYTTARDSIGFAQLALQYESPKQAVVPVPYTSLLDVIRRGEPPHPPLYPLAILGVSQVVRNIHPGPLPDAMLSSAQITSILASMFLVLPMYNTIRRLFDRRSAFAGVLIFQCLPVLLKITSDGLTESLFLFMMMLSISAGVQAVALSNVLAAFRAGIYGSLAYLVRPEGLMLSLAMMTLFIGLGIRRHDRRSILLQQAGMLILGTCLLSVPYMLTIGGVTLKPNGAEMLSGVAWQPQGQPSTVIFAGSYNTGENGNKFVWFAKTFIKELTKASHYSVAFLALVGITACSTRLKNQPELQVPLVVFLLNLVVITIFSIKAGYLSERHTLPMVMVLSLYASFGMFVIADFFVKQTPKLTPLKAGTGWCYLVMIVLSCIPQCVKPLHENRYGHKLIAEYLQREAIAEDIIIDPYTWAEFYMGRSLRGIPPDPNPGRYRWAILEENEELHSTFTRLEAALAVKADQENVAERVFEWQDPTDKKANRKIVLYRQTVEPQ